MARAQASDRESAAQLETILGAAPVGLGFLDRELRFLRLNDALARVGGCTREQHLGRELDELWSFLSPNGLRERLLEVLDGRSLTDIALTSGSGEDVRHLLASFYPVADEGDISGVGMVVVDISERERAARAVGASEARMRELLENIRLIAVALDTAGRVTFCNPFLAELTGYGRDELLGMDWFATFYPPGDQAHQRTFLKLLASDALNPHGESAIVTRSGQRRLIVWDSTAVHDVDGHVLGSISIGEDITERREAQEAVALSEARKSAILAASLDSIISMDGDGRFVEINPAAERAFGYSAADVVGREVADLIVPPSLRAAHRAGLARHLTSESRRTLGRRVELMGMRADGSEFPVEVALARVDVDGKPLFVGSFRDITERKRAETDLRAVLEEQAALRRVATLVAREAPEEDVFATVTEEVARLLDADTANMIRFDEDVHGTVVAKWSAQGVRAIPVGSAITIDGETVIARVRHSGRVERLDSYDGIEGDLVARLREIGIRGSLAAPITLDGALWGVVTASTMHDVPFPAGSEDRLGNFAELVAHSLQNAASRAHLAASRARIVDTADAERRRIERNLHDGAQQRLVTMSLTLRLAERKLQESSTDAVMLLATAREQLSEALAELRQLAQGIHPAILTERGLAAALHSLAARAPVPVHVEVELDGRLPPPVEAAAYFVASEALTNVAKYAQATTAAVRCTVHDRRAVVEITDDGVGGADVAGGSGLRGLTDRVEALGGRLQLESAPGRGTRLRAEIPCRDSA